MIIFLTGPIASGKSTALKMLQTRQYLKDPKLPFRFIDLDKFSKELRQFNKQVINDVREFLTTNTPEICSENTIEEHIITHVFSDASLYKQYCDIYEPYFVSYIENLAQLDGITVIECSALYSYPRVYELANGIIHIRPSVEISDRNKKLRNINNNKYERLTSIFNNNSFNYTLRNTTDKISYIKLDIGTFQEMRALVELALIQTINNVTYHPVFNLGMKYIDELYDIHEASINHWHHNPYHNFYHTLSVLTDLTLTGNIDDVLGKVAIYHDIGYNPQYQNKEQNSVSLYQSLDKQPNQQVIDIILETTYDKPLSDYTAMFALSDMASFNYTYEEQLEIRELLFKEYSHVSWDVYRTVSCNILNHIPDLHPSLNVLLPGITLACSWIKSYKPKIAWFCGSFNPFTVGHNNIYQKASTMFDKVVIVQALNPVKELPANCEYLKQTLQTEVICGCKSIVDLLESVSYKPVLIRGVRNNTDVEESIEWINQINEFIEEPVELSIITCDPRYKHISSSFVRHVVKLGKDASHLVI